MSKLFLNAPAEAAHGWPQAGDVMQSSSSPGLQIVSLFTELGLGIWISGYKESPSKQSKNKFRKKKRGLQMLKKTQPEDKPTSDWETRIQVQISTETSN